MYYIWKTSILLLSLGFYDLVQGKESLEDYTSINHVREVRPPFLRHTEGCRAVGMIWNRMPDNQLSYGLYYHMYLGQTAALRFCGGISPVKLNNKRHIQWVVAPSFFYTFSAYAWHYFSLSLGPIVEYGPYQTTELPEKKSWDIRIILASDYTFHCHKHWAFSTSIGPCIGLLKDKGRSGLFLSLGLQYNL